MSSQHPFTPFLKSSKNKLNVSQNDLSKRLSMPKITEDPYKDLRNTFRRSIGRGSFGYLS